MTIRPKLIGVLAAGCALGIVVPQRTLAIDDAEFNALKELVIKQSPSDDIICTKEVCMWHQTRQLEHHDLQIRPIYKTIMARKVSRRNEAHGGSPTQASGPV